MTPPPDFLTVEDVLFIHAEQIRLFGGDASVRDHGLLESAVAQAQAAFGGQMLHEYPFGMAAAYFFHLVQNHPFVDGNKRTGLVAALTFLDINGVEINAPTGLLYDLTIAVATGQADKARIAQTLAAHAG